MEYVRNSFREHKAPQTARGAKQHRRAQGQGLKLIKNSSQRERYSVHVLFVAKQGSERLDSSIEDGEVDSG